MQIGRLLEILLIPLSRYWQEILMDGLGEIFTLPVALSSHLACAFHE
jgi:hypothetical protein